MTDSVCVGMDIISEYECACINQCDVLSFDSNSNVTSRLPTIIERRLRNGCGETAWR